MGLDGIIGDKALREHALSVAMIVARVIDPQLKLPPVRGLGNATSFNTQGEILGVDSAGEMNCMRPWTG